MADLLSKISAELLEATKKRELVRVSTLRLLISAIRVKEIKKAKALTDGDILEIIQAEGKQRQESIDQYTKAGRQDLADKEKAEFDVLSVYLPAPLTEGELEAVVREAIAASGAKGPADIGKVMGPLMPKIKGRADGKQAQDLVKKLLS